MRKIVSLLVLLLLTNPAIAKADSLLSIETQLDVFGLMLMDEDNNTVSNVVQKNSNENVIEWELDVSYSDSSFVTLYVQDAAGNWYKTDEVYRMSDFFPEGDYIDGKASQGKENRTFASAWPQTSYEGIRTSVFPLEGEKRHQSFCGPGRSYHGAGAYKSYKIESVQALFVENGYVYVDLSYTTVGTRRLYFQSKIFTSLSGVPEVSFTGYSARTIETLTPQFGPGYSYDDFREAKINAGTSLSVFYEENGWVFAEFKCSKLGVVRAWILVEQIEPN